MAPFLLFRMILGYGSITVCSFLIFCISLTHKRGTPYTGWKYTMIKLWCKISARLTFYGVGILWFEEEKIDLDYKQYLGPDWKDNKDAKPSTIISNH